MTMASFVLAWLLLLLTPARALYVTSGSPCSAVCNSTNGTYWPDLVCADSDYSTTPKGILLESCLQCIGQSLYYVNDTRNDEYWFMFHMKYIQETCLVDANTITHTDGANQCATECNPLRTTLDTLWINKQPFLPQYNYCTSDADAYVTYGPQCAKCLQSKNNTVIVGNMMDTMLGACADQPLAVNNLTVKTSRDLFNTTILPLSGTTATSSATSAATVSATSTPTPAQTSVAVAESGGHGLSSGASAGIGIGIAVVVIAVASALFVFWRRSRNTRMRHDDNYDAPEYYDPSMDKKHNHKNVPYNEMSVDAARSEIYSHEMVEADGRPVVHGFPLVELPATMR